MVDAKDKLSWDIKKLADALEISENDVKEYFTDGRRVSFILERRIANDIIQGKIADSESASYDVVDSKGKKWEVRCISNKGVYFCPSNMVGKGRTFDKAGFLEKLEKIDGYILADIVQFPDIPCWIISSDDVKKWWNNGKLNTKTNISHNKALKLIEKL